MEPKLMEPKVTCEPEKTEVVLEFTSASAVQEFKRRAAKQAQHFQGGFGPILGLPAKVVS
jgi:hypothetical protein